MTLSWPAFFRSFRKKRKIKRIKQQALIWYLITSPQARQYSMKRTRWWYSYSEERKPGYVDAKNVATLYPFERKMYSRCRVPFFSWKKIGRLWNRGIFRIIPFYTFWMSTSNVENLQQAYNIQRSPPPPLPQRQQHAVERQIFLLILGQGGSVSVQLQKYAYGTTVWDHGASGPAAFLNPSFLLLW